MESEKLALTAEESGWLSLMRFNRLTPKREITKTWSLGRASLQFHWRSKHNLMGRFGGGWNWEFGFQLSSFRYIIFNLFICSVRWQWKTNKTIKPNSKQG